MRSKFRQQMGRLGRREDGVVAVIVALAMVVLFGFAALAIDEGSWMQTQRHCQNAADAAALSACDVLYYQELDINDAIDSAYMSAKMNRLPLDFSSGTDSLDMKTDDASHQVTVTITKSTDNYFSQVLTGKDQSVVRATATASLITASTPGTSYSQGSAVEGRKGINWQGNPGLSVTGGMETGGNLTVHSGTTYNGRLLANGSISMDSSNSTMVDGDLYSGGTVSLSEGGGIFKGSIFCQGDFKCTNTNTTIGQSVYTDGSVTLDRTTVNGDIEAKGSVARTDGGNVVGGSIRTNMAAVNTDGISVGGSIVTNAGLKAVPFVPYEWKWGQLKSDIVGKQNGIDYTTVDSGLVEEYIEAHPEQKYNISFNNDDITFNSGSKLQEFIDFCKESTDGAGSDHAVYFPGSLTVNTNQTEDIRGGIIVQDDITFSATARCTDSELSLISLEGNINFYQGPASINGMIMTLSDADDKGHINFSNGGGGGDINGGVVSSNYLQMDAKWNIKADTSWQTTIVSVPSSTKHVRLVS